MNTKNTFVKKLTALVLCLCMVLPMVTTGFAPMMAILDGIVPQADAAVTEKGKVAFYVPEVIYLYPNATSWRDTTSTPFQFYVENTVNTSSIYSQPTPNTELKTTGTIYFAAESGFSNVSIATRFCDANGNTVSGGSVTTGAFSNNTTYGTFSVTGGTSPSFSTSTTGCYIEWTVTYTNNAGERQSAIAYSYVYKPYTVPYGGVVWVQNTSYINSEARQITWVSGVHSVAACTETLDGAPYPRFGNNGTRSMAAFLSSQPTGYVGSTKVTGTLSQVLLSNAAISEKNALSKDMYAVFATTNPSTSYFYAMQSGSTWSNEDCWNWFTNDYSASGTYNIRSFNHWWKDNNKANVISYLTSTAVGSMYIDTSRYSNLAEIPNLGVGLMVTNDESSDEGSWYVADVTGTTNRGSKSYEGSDNRSKFYNDKNIVMARAGGASEDDMHAGSGYEVEERKYTGTWVRPLDKSVGQKTYTVKGYYGNHDGGDHALTHVLIDLKAIQSDKSTLRTAVNNAINAMGTLGLKDNYGSYYYDTNSAAWTAFKTAYRNACIGLTKLDGSCDVSGLATALNNAVTALKNGQGRKIFFNVNYGNINPNLYILGSVTDGGYGLTVSYGSDESITLNGTISGSNAFGTTPFTPTVNSYTFSTTLLSGSKNGDGCVVLDSGKEDTNNISTRSNFDFTGNAQKTITYNNTTAHETDLLRFWQWKNTQNDVYSNLKVRIKVEKGSTKTAYSPAARIATTSGTYGTLPTPDARTGYIFGGWYKEAACTNKVNAGDAVSADMLYAKWTPITYKIVYNANGNNVNGTMSEQVLTYDKATNLTNNAFSRTGYTWLNWNTAANGTGTTYTDGQSVLNLANVQDAVINMYAQWRAHTYTIKFNANGGTGSMADMAMTYDVAKNLTANAFTKDGYSFAGWTYDGTTYSDGQSVNNLTATDGGVVTLTAKWTADTQELTIDSNGGVNSANLIYNPDGKQSFSGGSDASLSYNIAFDENGAVDIYGNYTGGVIERTSTVDLWVYLEYGKMYEYSFTSTNDFTEFYLFPNGEAKNFASLNRKTNNSTTYGGQFVCGGSGALGDNSWNGVTTATGWYQLRLDQDCKTTSEAVVTAYEISDFVIREVTPDAVSQYKQPTDTKKYIPDPVRGGYTFSGWTGDTANLGTDKYYTFKSGSNTLVANWDANTYTITYNADGGTLTGDATQDYTPDAAVTIASAPTKTGYTFSGWLVTVADGNWVENSPCNAGEQTPTGMYGNITLTAQWSKNSYTYTVEHRQQNLDGATYTTVETETVTLNTEDTHTFAVKSYTGFTSPKAVTVTVDGTGELTIVYDYTRNKYNVTTSVNNDKAFASVTGAGEYYYGASVTLTANVNAGYSFTNWTKDGTSDANTSASFSFTLGAANVAWTANASAQDVSYTVIHEYETLTGGVYAADPALTFSAEVDTEVTPAFVNKEGFTAPAETQTVTVKGDGTTVVTYRYTRNSYFFTTDVDGVTTPVSYKYGADVTAPTAPTKVGYTFAGWSSDVPATMPASDITVVATWTTNTHTIIYKVDGVEVHRDADVEYGSAVTAYTYTAPRGYEFNGWSEIPATMPDNDLTINGTTTKLTYTIKATLDGGSINNDFDGYEITYQVDTAEFTIPDPVKTGFTFTGWTENGTNLGKNLTINPADANFNLRNMNLVATWEAAQVNYTVETYVMGTDGKYGTPTIETKQALTGDTATADTSAKTGFTLDTNHEGYLTSDTVKADGSLVLKVFYKRNQFTVKLTAGQGVASVNGAGTFYFEAPVFITATLKDGYKTLTWSGTVPTTMPNNDVNLTATASLIDYEISYDLAGGAVSGTNPTAYNVESADITLVNPTRNGYTFAGWTGTGLTAATQTVTIAKGSTGNRTYTATWTPVTYTISYNLNGGTVATANPTEYTIESENIILNNPTKQGYAFAGWTGTGIDGTSDAVEIAKGSTGNREYTATWTESTANYTVKHYRQALDGSYPDSLLDTVVTGSTTGKTETAALNSYDGFTAPEAKTVTVLADGSATVEYYYTRNSYKIVYYTVNADDAQIAFKTIEALYEASVPAVTEVPTRTGYEFTKWDVACPATMPLNGLEITALWNPSTFTITYVGVSPEEISKFPSEHKYDTETDISEIPTRDGYTFAGWTFNGNPITFENNKIGKRQFSDNFTLTATWTANPTTYTVETYLMGTDGKYPETATLYEVKDAETDKPITAVHEAKTGFTADTEKSVLSGTAAWNGSSVLKLYYSRNQYDLTLEAGTGVASVTGDGKFYYEQSVTIGASLLAGYDWAKWTKGDAEFETAQNYTFTMPAEALTVKANAKLHTYNINITLNNGAFAAGYTAPTSYDVTKEDITIPDPTRTGYTFNGWLVNDATAPQKNYTIDTAKAVDVTLVADWTAIEYKITYVLGGGTNAATNPDTYTIESAEIKLADPTKTGYKFIKWIEGDTIAAGSTGNKTFTAEWEALGVEYNIVTHFEGFTADNYDSFVNGKGSADADSTVQINDIAVAQTGFTFKEAKLTEGGEVVTEFKNGTTDGAVTVHLYYTRNSYTLTFDTDGGTAVDEISYKYAAEVATPATTTKTGYTFAGWENLPAKMPANDMTAKAKWTINQYTITFANTGDSTIDPITANYGTAITAPEDPTKTGYTFKEWTPALAEKMPVGGQTLEAVWTANTYKVTYDYSVPENVTVTHTGNVPNAHTYGTATPVADPERAGYTFAGWTINDTVAGGTGLTLAADGYTADITLKANWTANAKTYKVEFYYQDVNNMSSYICNGSETLTLNAKTDDLIEYNAPEKEGFVFNPEKSYMTGVVPAEGTLIIEVFYDRDSYTLTWEIDGVQTIEDLCYGQTIDYPENPTKTGYNFIGWTPANITTMPAEDITLTAQFAASDHTAYKVIHKLEDLNADTYFEKETELKYGTTASEVTPEVKSYEGFTAPTTQTVIIAADGSTVVEYLYKRNSYDVTIVATDAGLSNATASQMVEFEGTLDVSVTVANGYEFKGWTSNNEKVASSETASYTITMPASAVTLTANAEIIEYTVSYDLDGGALADGKTNPTEFYVTTDTFTLNNPEKKGYTFLGWTGSNGTTEQTEVSVEKGTYQDLSYTAKWALIPYAITYDLAGGSVAQANATQYFVTTATFTLNNPTRAGYTFTGWTGTDLDGNVETVTITTGSVGDRSYTATWKANDIDTVVNYYWQNIDDDGYTLQDTVNGTVKNDTVFAPEVKTYEGFVSPEAQSVKVENGVAVTIDYYYDRETYTVTLTAGTGIDSVSGADTYRYGKEITVSAVVSTGYTWKNWTTTGSEAEASKEQAYPITIGTANIALTANATLDTYTITYSGLDQYTTVTENPSSYNVHSDAIVLNNPAKDGYTFTGWTGTDLAGNTMEVKIEKGSVGNREYVANWNRNTYNLTYDLANGSFAEGDSIPATYTVDDVVTLPTPVRTGYTFKGWSDGKTTAMNVTLNRATGDRHYTAVWEANGDTKYTVKHYLMGLDGQYTATAYETKVFDNGTSDADITPAVNTYTGFTSPSTQTVKVNPDGSTVVEYKYSRNKYALTYYTVEGQLLQTQDLYFGATIPVAPTATRDGYTFKEWNTEIPAKMPAHAVDITALWNTVAYTVTFNANGGKEMAAISYDIEIPVTLPKAERTGYDFAGWTVTKTQGNWSDTIADNNAALEAGLWGNVTLTANWTARQDTKYVVKHMFMATDGKTYVEDESKRVEATGTSDSKVTPAVLSVTGFTSPEAQEITIAADGSTILEYQYKRNQYTLTWKIKGSDDEKLTYYYDEPVTAKADPVLAGHTFIRWSRSVPANMPAENIEIIANFDIITYKITIDYNGGKEVTNPTTYTVETDTFTLNNPTRDGYEFLGWTGTDLDGASTSVTIEKGSTGDRTYKAKWNAKNQDWFVDVYYMTTKGDYSAAPEVLEKSNTTDTKVSFDSKDKLKDGFTFDEANSSISGTVPGTGTLRLTAKYSRNQYTVTYDFANGTADKVVTTYYEAELAAVTDPVRTGYTFAGWYDADGNKVDALPETMPLEGGTYTARWTADNYQLTLVENGGTAVEDISYDIEDTVTLPVLTRDGYFFQGWKVTAENGNWLAADAYYAAGTPVSGKYGSATLTAQWTTVQYTLTFDTKGGTVSEASLSYTIEEDKQLPTPVRPGYTFNGWKVTEVSNIANDSGNVSWVVGNTYKAAISVLNTYGNATFEAQWSANTYTVSNDTANITYEGETTATVDVNYTATLTPHAGYTLPATITLTIGGKDAIVNTDYTYTVHADGTATITVKGAAIIGDIAIKVERNIVTYNISYNLNNATTDPKNATTYNVETAVTLTPPERTGYTFLGWTGSNGTTPETKVTIPVGTTGDKNYVANWQADPREYTVEIYYMTTDGTYNTTPDKSWPVNAVTDAQVSYNINDPATLLTGFSANENISTLTGTVPATGALTLVAKYDRNKYALTVNGCEGITAATGTVEYFYDKEIVVDATVAMGYTWVEWKSADETALAGSTDKKHTFNMPANAAELTAVATLDVYGISYDLADGTLADGVTNPATYTVTTDTFTLNNPTKVGYDFIGWTGTDLATPTMNVTIAKNSTTGDKSYTANWKAIEYTVSYDLDEGTAQGNNYTVYTIETAAQTLTAPVKTGYTFLGWTGSNGTEPKTDVTIAGGTIGNLSFTANWSADAHTYTVEYRTQTTEGVYAEQPDKTETINSYTDAEVSVAITPDKGFYIADTSILSGTVKHDNSLVLKVYIGRHQYDVTLVDGGDGISSVNTNTTKVYFDAPVEVNAVVENGYTFEKWTSADEAVLAGSVNNPYTFKMPAGNITLTASATLNRYNINYTMNGGTNNAANPTTYTVLDAVNIKQPTRLGYTFTGWSGSYYGKNVYIAAGNTGDINLTANWSINTYTVTYDLAGGSVDGTNRETYDVHDSFTLINPTRVGYDFAGWTGSFAGENVTVPENTTGNLTFTANWTARTDTQYTVNFYIESVNGDNTYTLSDDSYVAEYVSDKDLTVSAPAITGFATPVALSKKIAADGSTVFNFYYERNQYTYTFKAIGYEDIVKTYFYEYPITKPTDPTRAGYEFVNWNPVVVGTMPAHDVTSVAEWKAITYTIGYDLAGGNVSGNPTSYTVENGYTLVNPVRNGYAFAGWTGTGLTEPTMLVTVEKGSIGNRSYTATWTPVRYEITYDFAGGTDNGANPISYTIEDNITLVNPTKVGYTFAGWRGTGVAGSAMVVSIRNTTGDRSYTATWRANNDTVYTVLHYQQDIGSNTYTLFETEEKTGTTMSEATPKVKTYPGFTSPSAKTVTILPDGSAKVEYYYTRNTYTIFFDSNGGSPVSSKTFAFGEELTGLETPSFLGYTFAGWTPALPETMTAGNLYVTADWKANTDTPYTVYHYFQDVDCVSYPEELMKVEYCYGETGAIVEVATWDVEGFTAPAKRSIVIAADGSRTVRYYYTRNTYTVTFVDHNDNILELQSVVYGLPATPPVLADRAPDADGHYTFAGWSEDTSFIHGYTTIKAMYTAEAHDPGADADCTNALICTKCGYEIAPANGHVPVVQTPAVEPTCTTAGNTADSVCSVCGEVLSRYQIVPALGHEIGSWYVDVPATATTTGILKRVCSRCDWSETHEIPVLSDSPVVSIDITTSGSQAYVGTSYQLVTEIKPSNAANKQVIWESSDPSIASVTADGFITSHKPGEVTFTVTTLDGLKTDSITINFFYSADHYNLLLLDLFACNLYLDGKPLDAAVGQIVRVKAGSTLAFTIDPTTDEYIDQGGYIFTANGSNVEADANGVYYIYNVHENIEITALPAIGKPEFDDDQQYDTDEVPEKSIFAKILAFFERIAEWFRNLFK